MRILNDKIETSMCKLSLEIKRFLKENGGMRDGYQTAIEANFSLKNHDFYWITPTSKNLTGKELDEKSMDFVDNIKSKNILFGDMNFEVKSYETEHGCFDIFISITRTKKLNLW